MSFIQSLIQLSTFFLMKNSTRLQYWFGYRQCKVWYRFQTPKSKYYLYFLINQLPFMCIIKTLFSCPVTYSVFVTSVKHFCVQPQPLPNYSFVPSQFAHQKRCNLDLEMNKEETNGQLCKLNPHIKLVKYPTSIPMSFEWTMKKVMRCIPLCTNVLWIFQLSSSPTKSCLFYVKCSIHLDIYFVLIGISI